MCVLQELFYPLPNGNIIVNSFYVCAPSIV